MAVSLDEKKKKNFSLRKSEEAFAAAKVSCSASGIEDLMPGGVSSPVCAFKSVGGQPIVIDSVKGSRMWDIDGNEYIDYVGSWGPAIIGHADDEVLAALAETMKKGTSFGAPCLLENVLAKMVISAVPSIEMVRFVNSGTEACIGVLRLARAFTGKERIIKLEGCYHGHGDPFLVKAGSALWKISLRPTKELIAGVILEPVAGNAGFIAPKPDFLMPYTKSLKNMIIGGGLPVGAYGGRRDIMEMVAPAGPVYQAGTLSGNPLAMTAGIHTLKRLQEPGTYKYLDKITGELVQGLVDAGKKAGHAMCGGSIGGMFGFFFTEGPVYNFEDAKKSDTAKFARFYRGMLEEGVYFSPSQFEAGFTSLAHTPEDIQKTIAAAEKVLQQI
uniref:Glutamate-1-semialdehyde 2,1-aminomutase n=1 Tax=Fagus sylvatica TaxID=28930 RepID=A0A2N9J289_FAGSY